MKLFIEGLNPEEKFVECSLCGEMRFCIFFRNSAFLYDRIGSYICNSCKVANNLLWRKEQEKLKKRIEKEKKIWIKKRNKLLKEINNEKK